MTRKWKRLQPNSLLHALRLCKDYAREVRNLSVERIADRMSVSHDALYKWLATGRMPANLIPTYELVCGIPFVTRWQAATTGKLLVDMPSGKAASPEDIAELQEVLNGAVGNLIKFGLGKIEVEETQAALQNALEALAYHRGNVEKYAQPEFDFGGEE
jgi:hypothetical protein